MLEFLLKKIYISHFVEDLQIELERRKRVELRSAELKTAQVKSTLSAFELGMLKKGNYI